jgi:transcriptional regulator with XRE-family HTH domain
MAVAREFTPDFQFRASQIVQVVSQTELADLIGVHRSSVSRWVRGEDVPDPDRAASLLGLDYVVNVYAQHRLPSTFITWLQSPNAFLNGAAPAAVLEMEGPGRVVAAVQAEAAGSFA